MQKNHGGPGSSTHKVQGNPIDLDGLGHKSVAKLVATIAFTKRPFAIFTIRLLGCMADEFPAHCAVIDD